MIQPGDVVCLKTEGGEYYPMLVLDISRRCDGTGGDGNGLLCAWQSEYDLRPQRSWVSESSVFKPLGVKWGVMWNGLPMPPMIIGYVVALDSDRHAE